MDEVFIGGKSLASYVTAGLISLSKNKAVKIIGRGRHVKAAIDVAEILKRHMKNPSVKVDIGSEKFNDRYVSTIEIELIEKD